MAMMTTAKQALADAYLRVSDIREDIKTDRYTLKLTATDDGNITYTYVGAPGAGLLTVIIAACEELKDEC